MTSTSPSQSDRESYRSTFDQPGRSLAWTTRDWLAAILLSLATAAFVCWQSSQLAVLWDLGYLLDSSYRIALGQIPYRDFPFVHAPLTFLIQAAIIRLAGRSYLYTVLYAAIAGGLASVITWRLLLFSLREAFPAIRNAWLISVLLTSPLVFLGIYSVYPHPVYDSDCTLSILIALMLFGRTSNVQTGLWNRWLVPIGTGTSAVLPLFFKQNMGLPFLLAVALGLLLLLAQPASMRSSAGLDRPTLLKILAGIALALTLAAVILHLTAGIGNYLHWTVTFPSQRRLPGLGVMLGVYRQQYFAWLLIPAIPGLILLHPRLAKTRSVRIIATCLLSAPFLWALIFPILNENLEDRADSLLALWPLLLLMSAASALINLRRGLSFTQLIPFFTLAAIHGAFLSQQLWGSTYAVWPLLLILIAQILATLPASLLPMLPVFACTITATFLISGSLYAISHDRLSYVQIPDSPLQHSTLPALRGISLRGPYLSDFEELIRYTDAAIPREDKLLLLPGEGPFYFATSRAPTFPVLLFDPTTDPLSPTELFAEAARHNVRWLILKRRLQLTDDPMPDAAATYGLIADDFLLFHQLAGYDVYRRR